MSGMLWEDYGAGKERRRIMIKYYCDFCGEEITTSLYVLEVKSWVNNKYQSTKYDLGWKCLSKIMSLKTNGKKEDV